MKLIRWPSCQAVLSVLSAKAANNVSRSAVVLKENDSGGECQCWNVLIGGSEVKSVNRVQHANFARPVAHAKEEIIKIYFFSFF